MGLDLAANHILDDFMEKADLCLAMYVLES